MSAAMNQMYGNYAASTDQTAAMMGQSTYGTHQLSPGSSCNTSFLGGAASAYNTGGSCSSVPTDYSPPAGAPHPCSLTSASAAAASMGALSAAANNASAASYSSMFNSLYDRSALNNSSSSEAENSYSSNYNQQNQHLQQNQPPNWNSNPPSNQDPSQTSTDTTAYGSAQQRLQSPYSKHSHARSTAGYKSPHSAYVPPPQHPAAVKQQPLSPSGSTGSMQSLSPASSDQSPYHGNTHPSAPGIPATHNGLLAPHNLTQNNYHSSENPVNLANRGW